MTRTHAIPAENQIVNYAILIFSLSMVAIVSIVVHCM
jgi:hypothetical protein